MLLSSIPPVPTNASQLISFKCKIVDKNKCDAKIVFI
jgi:hypothetical protein